MIEDTTSDSSQGDQDTQVQHAHAGSYQVSIKGPGIAVSKAVDSSIALQIVTTLIDPGTHGFAPQVPQAVAPTPSPTAAPAFTRPPDATSIGEYIESLEARRNPDKIVAIGLYIKKYQGNNTFVKEDLKRYFQQAGETPPANINRDVRATLAAKWIAPATDPNAEPNTYWVTNKGAQAAAQHFSAEVQKTAPTKRTVRRRTNKSNGIGE